MTEQTKNPLLEKLNKVIQGETFRLPSKGLFYKNNELDETVVNGEILIYPVTTIEEIMLRTYDMLYQGTAIEKVFSRCIPQIKAPLQLLAKDVDYVLTCLRKVSYGNEIPIPFKCTDCGDKAVEHIYNVPIHNFLKNLKEIDPEDLGKYKITLSSGHAVNLRPSKFLELLKISNYDDNTQSITEAENILVDTLSSIILDVDGITDEALIKALLRMLPTAISKELQDKVIEVNDWGPVFTFKINCIDCGKPKDLSTIVNPVYFFMLPSSLQTKKN
jgi:hypothetical protein